MPDLEPHRDLSPALKDTDSFLGRLGAPYHPHPDLLAAANVALTLGRPLLLTGEPGCGKTDFAWAAASVLTPDEELLDAYVRSDSRAQDLLYHYDALTRFGDAQHGGEEGRRRAADPRSYITLLPLGRALTANALRVVLIDEIDKAPRDLPNDLLRELDQGRFTIPEIPDDAPPGRLARHMGLAKGAPRPFVVITSNVERQLPDAFLRRCVFYHLRFPDDTVLDAILADRERTDRRARIVPRDDVISAFLRLRGIQELTRKPATAELLDWDAALGQVWEAPGLIARFDEFKAAVRKGQTGAALPWGRLPAVGCLVKLREDLVRLGAV